MAEENFRVRKGITVDGTGTSTIAGKVGIGTTAPVSKFHIENTAYDFDDGTQDEDGDFHLMLKATETSTAGDAVTIGFAQSSDGTTVGAKISHVIENSFSRGALVFSTNNTASAGDTTAERMRITGAGNVGIGTTSPAKLLHLESTMPEIYMVDSDATNTPNFRIFNNVGNANYRADDGDTGTGGAHLFYTSGTEKMRLSDGGSLGIGTSSPEAMLHLRSDTADVTLKIEADESNDDESHNPMIWMAQDGELVNFKLGIQESGNHAYLRWEASTDKDLLFLNDANERMRLTGDGNLGIGTTSPTAPLHIDHDATNPDTDADFAIKIDHDSTGSASTTGDREQGGLYVDADSSTTGGDQSNEHRLYGVWSDTRVNSSGDPDAVYGVYGYSEDQRSGTSGMTTISNLAGGWFVGASDATNSVPAISGLYGVYGSASIQDTGTISNSHSVRGLTAVSANRAANVNNLRGVSSEIDIASTRTGGDITINWARVFEAVFDHNVTDASGDTAVVTDGYLYYGDYAVSQSDQITNKWGLYINDEDKNYISGNLGIGTTAPDAPLHVEHSSGLIAKMGEGNVETRMQFADARAMIGYQGDHAIIQGGSGGKGVSLNVNNGTFGSGVALRVTSDGDVGIGTTSPEGKLEIEQDTTTGHALKVYRNQSSSNMDSALVYLHDDSQYADEAVIHVKQDGTGSAGIFEGGNVGIGTTSPAHNLDVASNSNPTIFIRNTDAAHNADDKIGSLLFFNAEDSTGGDGSRVGAGLRYVATDAYGRGRLELTAGTSNPISSYNDTEVYTDDSIARLSILTDSGKVGIGTTSPEGLLDIRQDNANNAFGLVVGANVSSQGLSDNTRKFTRIGMHHYHNAEEHVNLIIGDSDGTDNKVSIGGGTNQGNAATKVQFYAAANDATVTGTVQANITSSGLQLGTSGARVTTVLDEDAMGSDSATALATQQSIKAYVDSQTSGTVDKFVALQNTGTGNASPNINVNNTTAQAITWLSEVHKDSIYTHSTSTNPEEITVTEAGTYLITYNINTENNGSNRFVPKAFVYINGTVKNRTMATSYSRGAGYDSVTTANWAGIVELSANDVVEVRMGKDDADQTTAVYVQKEGTQISIARISAVGNKASVIAVSSGTTTLTNAQSGSVVYLTSSGAVNLPSSMEKGVQFVIINDTGGNETPGLNSNTHVLGTHGAMSANTARTYVAVSDGNVAAIG